MMKIKIYSLSLLFAFLFLLHNIVYPQTIQGVVIDKATNKPLIGVNIVALKTFRGTASNTNGKFKLTLQKGTHTIRFSIIGYKSITKEIVLSNSTRKNLTIYMEQQPFNLKGIVVEEEKDNNFIVANYNLNERSIKNVPAFIEADVMRAVSVLPGIVNYNDFKGAVSIRGSSPDQTQVLYDGMEIYYPWHLFGALGSFNLQPIKKVQVFTGGFPAEYGNRAGGIVDIHSKDFNGNSFFNVNISLLTTSIFYNNKFGNFEILAAARKTYLDVLSQFFYRIPYGYVDANLKLRYTLNNNWHFELLGYGNNDFFTTSIDEIRNTDKVKFKLSDFFKTFFKGNVNWGNKNLGFKTKFVDRDFNAELLIFNSIFGMDFPKMIDNKLNDLSFKLKTNYLLNPTLLLQTGLEYKKIKTKNYWKFNFSDLLDMFPAGRIPVNENSNNDFLIFHSGLNWIYKNLDAKLGFRFTHSYEKNILSPRLTLKYNVSKNFNVFSTTGRYVQFLISPFENSVLTIGNPLVFANKPLEVYNFSVGSEKKITPLINSKLELYYKKMYNLPLDINNTFKDIKTGSTDVFGADLLIHKNFGYFTWQLSYSFLKTIGNYNGEKFPLDWEISHKLSILAGLTFKKGWYSNIGLTYRTGLPYTPVISSFYGISEATGFFGNDFIYGERNSNTYPQYIRLDFSLSKKYSWQSLDLVLNLQIINFLYRKNILKVDWGEYYFSDVYYDYEGNEVRNGILNGIPILPSIGVELYFK